MEWYHILLIVLGSIVGFFLLASIFYRQFFKRFFDITLSALGLIIAGIPMIITAILARIFIGSPIVFKQERVGRKEKHFYIIKFRTMTDKRDANGELLPDSERFTKFGKILRKTSLDELPQLFNVIKGDISLVGPRPMMPKYMPSDEDVRKKRFSIRPGITGLAQINGRTNITYSERFAYDIDYAEHISLLGDFKILWGTAMHVLRSLVKKGGPIRAEDMEMLKGTMEYERLKALENTSANTTDNDDALEEAAIADDKVASIETRPSLKDAPIGDDDSKMA